MQNNHSLPVALDRMIDSEPTDFRSKAKYAYSRGSAWGSLIFGLVWTGFSSIFVIAFIGPLFTKGRVDFTMNDVPTSASWDNLAPLIAPVLFIGFFLLIGFAIIVWAIYAFTKKGGYFVGTPTRMIVFDRKGARSIDWEQFAGDITIKGNERVGTIIFKLRTGSMQKKNNSSQFVPEEISLVGIERPYDIEQICRKRIKENDPTPSQSGSSMGQIDDNTTTPPIFG